jgi:parallel beta-helix repeat protein
MKLSVCTTLVLAVGVLLGVKSVQANTYDVTNLPGLPMGTNNADPSGVNDSVPAFQFAVDLAEADGGGTVYVPAGTYSFQTDDGNGHNVVIKRGGVHIKGDSQGGIPGGVGIAVETYYTDAFYLYDESTNMSGGLRSPPSGTIIENIRVTRHTLGSEGTGSGIRISVANVSGWGTIENCTFRNVLLDHAEYGIVTQGAEGARGQVVNLLVEGCTLRNNGVGALIEDFSSLHISHCDFRYNFGNGLHLSTYVASTSGGNGDDVGGAFIQGCRMKGNGDYGLWCSAEFSEMDGNVMSNVHLTGCDMSGNSDGGFYIYRGTGTEISGCNIGSNSGYSGGYFYQCKQSTVTGCTFRGNQGRGFYVFDSSGVAVSGCSFHGNSAYSVGGVYALVVYGGSTQSYTGLSFTGSANSGTQTRGIVFSSNGTSTYDPKGIIMQGITFEGSMTLPFAKTSLSGSEKYRIDMLSPQNWTGASPASTYAGSVMQYYEN